VIQPGAPGWTATLNGAHTSKLIFNPLIPYQVVVPEPASLLAWLALFVAVAGAARRR
jgi:hypothetical protein